MRTLLFSFLVLIAASSHNFAQTKPAPPPTERGTVSVCKEIDDNWKCVGEADTWGANQRFNVLFLNPTPIKFTFVGIIFHKQLPDGTDGDHLYEFQQNMGDGNRKYATTDAPFYLPAGTYTIYILQWDKRDSLYKKGNYKDYLAKMTLKVK